MIETESSLIPQAGFLNITRAVRQSTTSAGGDSPKRLSRDQHPTVNSLLNGRRAIF